jgi:pyrimidine-nucleoside phosphorylase
MHVKLGARIQAGEPLCTLFTEEPHRLDQPEQMLRAALTIADEPPQIARMIRQVITSNDIRSAEP